MVHVLFEVIVHGPVYGKREKLARVTSAILASYMLYAMANLVELGTSKCKKRYKKSTTGSQRRARKCS
jgi:hypothetical protein